MTRKAHVQVPQARYLEVMRDVGLMSIHPVDIADFLEVSPTTAVRKLDGLAAQGKVIKLRTNAYCLPDEELE